jgi:proteic killer suppression protein
MTVYNVSMIKSFRHKGLKNFFEKNDTKGINPNHAPKINRILTRLDYAEAIQDMNLPGYRLHPLKGDLKNLWAVDVNGNYRITFRFEDGNAYILDYQDYH